MEHAFILKFKASNTEAEYKALFVGLQLAYELNLTIIQVFRDSQFEAKEYNMSKYLTLVKVIIGDFKSYSIN